MKHVNRVISTLNTYFQALGNKKVLLNNEIMAGASDFTDIIYKSVDSIMELLNRPEYKNLDPVRQLVATYHRVSEEETEKQDPLKKKYPLIVLEGLDGCGKSTATKRLSRTLKAELYSTPPKCLLGLRPTFDSPDYKMLRAVYYALGNYIAAFEMMTTLQTKPIVLDRFWHSTAAYAIAQAVEDKPERYSLPPEASDIYSWPKDLLCPDLIMFLSVSEHVRLQRLGGREELTTQEHLLQAKQNFRNNVILAYKRMYDPVIQMVNGQQSKRKTELKMLTHVRQFPLLTKVADAVLMQG